MLLVAYDIPLDRRREKVAGALLRYGRRVQYSVFLLERGSAAEVGLVLGGLCEAQEDNIRIQPLCMNCARGAILLGVGREGEKPSGYRVI